MKDPRLRLSGLAKKFGNHIAVYPTDLSVAPGEFVVALGPSGCGKTTTLRMIAGLENPSQGSVHINGKEVTHLRAGDRDIAFVFQMFSLYPHMTVRENVSFTLRAQGVAHSEATLRAEQMLRSLGLGEMAKAFPARLSGGDQQRVGLARALVRTPQAFLMDEPLGTLDGALRVEMRETLRAMHNRSGSTTLLVTHDQEEAMGLADRIAIMKDGRVVQFDHPRIIYDTPASIFVADFVGSPGMNILRARRNGEWAQVAGLTLGLRLSDDGDGDGLPAEREPEGDYYLGVRPENVLLSESGAPCVVEHTQVLGSHNLLSLRLTEGFLKAWIPTGIRFREGETVGVTFLTSGCRWFHGRSGLALPWKTLEAACLATL